MIHELRENQKHAIKISVNNDFSSGIHYHATGTGKSWIALNILEQFNLKYPDKNVLWICERKDILKQQFARDTLKERKFAHILKKFNVLDFAENKIANWTTSLDSARFWGKPFLCIINRCFLTSGNKYERLKSRIDLVIHDECHSIENKTTEEFYKWLMAKTPETKIIGFSATPEYIKPLDTILSKYSIYDGFLDKVILPPKIVWLKSSQLPNTASLTTLLKTEIDKLPYKKIIVWCGMIEECLNVAAKWSSHFPNYKFHIDFNNIDVSKTKNYGTFDQFYSSKGNSILFCAVKHREGSDIPFLDGCIFMDLVSQRSERVFIQCMGRVLRTDKNKKKKYGLVIDLKARGTIDICNRVQHYLKLNDVFPWKYSIKEAEIVNDQSDIVKCFVNSLKMIKADKIELSNKDKELDSDKEYTANEIKSYFKRQIPAERGTPKYMSYFNRIDKEIKLIIEKRLFQHMIRAIEILKLTDNIPHITRGSCGSSLICYMLGISHVDPIRFNVSFARFLNKWRDTLPDIDFDFPHYMRDEVFLKLFQRWGSKVARISNHNFYHEKSALREAMRRNGIHKFISKYDIEEELRSYDRELRSKIYATQQELEGTFKGFSLHCGGIIYFPDGIPETHLLEKSHGSLIPQVDMNKIEVAEAKQFKIDILSSRGLSQLYYCNSFNNINFYEHLGDLATIDLLCSGNNIGITLAETPLMRKALMLVKPKTVMDLAICLAIIRPAAKDAKQEFEVGNYKQNSIIFDDDAIQLIAKLIGCDEDMADKIRRGYCKGKKDAVNIVNKYLQKKTPTIRKKIKTILGNLRKYGFCKAHALSYAQLVWQLAYQKAHHPDQFWKATLKNVDSCYRKWVHIYEAKCVGVSINEKKIHRSIYAENKAKKLANIKSQLQQIQNWGYWDIQDTSFLKGCYSLKLKEDKYRFRGLIASSRIISCGKMRKLVLFIGVGKHKYCEVVIAGRFYFDSRKLLVKGEGILKNNLYKTIECEGNKVEFI